MKYLLFGTGDYYERYKKWFEPENIVALLDNSPLKQGTFIDGIQVLPPEKGIEKPFDIIVILSFYVKEMKQQLLQLGVLEDKICHFYGLRQRVYQKDKKKPILYYGNAKQRMVKGEKNYILLLSHDLNYGGPALALYYAAKMLIKHGYHVVVASMIDGPLRRNMLLDDIPVVVDVNLQIETMNDAKWMDHFSCIICNTINFYVFLSDRNTKIPVLWWLHDSEFFYGGVDRELIRRISQERLCVASVGPVPEKAIKKFLPNISVKRLLYGVERNIGSIEKETRAYQRKNVCFVTIGYIETRKGQDILVEAIQNLSFEERKKAEFYFVGQNTSNMAQQIIQLEIPEIKVTGTKNREEIHRLLEQADVLICPSREDPMPTVAVEAMMHRVPCILSDAVGTAEFIHDKKNGLLFESENKKELAEKIRWCINHKEELSQMGLDAEQVYYQYFSMDVFERNLLEIVTKLCPINCKE